MALPCANLLLLSDFLHSHWCRKPFGLRNWNPLSYFWELLCQVLELIYVYHVSDDTLSVQVPGCVQKILLFLVRGVFDTQWTEPLLMQFAYKCKQIKVFDFFFLHLRVYVSLFWYMLIGWLGSRICNTLLLAYISFVFWSIPTFILFAGSFSEFGKLCDFS